MRGALASPSKFQIRPDNKFVGGVFDALWLSVQRTEIVDIVIV